MHVGVCAPAGDVFSGMDWMTEKLDLSDFDLDSLIGSCDSDEPPSSPEELLACLDTDLDLDSFPFGAPLTLDLQEPVEVKSEPLDTNDTLELGSEVCVVQSAEIMLTPSHIVLDPSGGDLSDSDSGISEPSLKPAGSSRTKPYSRPDPDAPREETSGDPSDSDSGISEPSPRPAGSSRTKPYSRPDPDAPKEETSGDPSDSDSEISEPSPKPAGSSRTKPYSRPDPDAPKEETSGDPSDSDSGIAEPSPRPAGSSRTKPYSRPDPDAPKVVHKKQKKMEQNKTAATRYRQKKRTEQETLNSECAELEKRNRQLQEKAEAISREIRYLRDSYYKHSIVIDRDGTCHCNLSVTQI